MAILRTDGLAAWSGGNAFSVKELLVTGVTYGDRLPPALRDVANARLARRFAETRAVLAAADVADAVTALACGWGRRSWPAGSGCSALQWPLSPSRALMRQPDPPA